MTSASTGELPEHGTTHESLRHTTVQSLRDGIGKRATILLEYLPPDITSIGTEGIHKLSELPIPLIRPKRLRRLAESLGSYIERYSAPVDDRSPYERVIEDVWSIHMNDSVVTLRQPAHGEEDQLMELYRTGLSSDDLYLRFFAHPDHETAANYGIACSSLRTPDRAVDFIGTDGQNIVGHAGYVIDGASAELHIVVHPDYRRGQNKHPGVAEELFRHAVTAAVLDPRITRIVIDTLAENGPVNKLLDAVADVTSERPSVVQDGDVLRTTIPLTITDGIELDLFGA